MSGGKRTLKQETAERAGNFLFDMPTDESDALDMRTRIKSVETTKVLMYYGILGDEFGSEVAKKIKSRIERLLISTDNGAGRREAVETLNQNLPKKVEVEKGWETPKDEDPI